MNEHRNNRKQDAGEYVCLRIGAAQRQRLNLLVAQMKMDRGRTVTQTEVLGHLLDMAGVPDAHRPEST